MSDDADWWRYYWAGWDTWNGETPDSEPVDEEVADIPMKPDCRVAFRAVKGNLGAPDWEL